MKNSIAIIVLNWNGAELTMDCLASLLRVRYDAKRIMVVDNGSEDNSVSRIREKFPEVHILALEKNLGFAAGNNAGFHEAKTLWDPEFCLFLNNDTVVDPEFLTPLVSVLGTRDHAIVVPKIYYYHEQNRIWFAGGLVNLWSGRVWHRGIREWDAHQFDETNSVDYATGCCLAIRTEDFESLGGFDTTYTMYAEDVDLSLRYRKQGGEIIFVPKATIWHKVSASVGGAMSREKIYRRVKSHLHFLIQHARWYQWPTIILYLPVQLVSSLVKYISLR